MTKVHGNFLGEGPQTFLRIVRDWVFGFSAIVSSSILGFLLIGISLPFICLFIGGCCGWFIAQHLLVPPIETCMRKVGFSDAWVEKTKKGVTYSMAALCGFAYFGFTFLN